jgi:hypothetical protein
MKHQQHVFITVALISMLLAISGCSSHGKLSGIDSAEQEALLADLVSRQDLYVVHSHGNSEKFVSGILFDPKGDGKNIRPEGTMWKEVSDSETIAAAIASIQRNDHPGYLPRLSRILSPDGDFYGYLFTGWSYMAIKTVDDHTLRVFGLKGSPVYEDMYSGGR